MFDSAPSSMDKQELEKLRSGEIDYYEVAHPVIPAIIFDYDHNRSIKAPQLHSLPLNIDSLVNFPAKPTQMDILKENLHDNSLLYELSNQKYEQCKLNLMFYISTSIKQAFENFMLGHQVYKIIEKYTDGDIYPYPSSAFETALEKYDKDLYRIYDSAINIHNGIDMPWKVKTFKLEENELKDLYKIRTAKVELIVDNLFQMYSLIISEASSNIISKNISDIVYRNNAERIDKEVSKFVDECNIDGYIRGSRPMCISVLNYILQKDLKDFLQDHIYNVIKFGFESVISSFYYAMEDYLQLEIKNNKYNK